MSTYISQKNPPTNLLKIRACSRFTADEDSLVEFRPFGFLVLRSACSTLLSAFASFLLVSPCF